MLVQGAGRGATSSSRWPLRCALLLVALGVVLMHHLAGGCSHGSSSDPAMPGMAGMSAVATMPPAHHDDGGPTRDTAAEPPARAPGGEDVAGLLHLCLAVLVAAVTWALSLLALSVGRPAVSSSSARPVDGPAARAPPPPRLAQLQVLRI